VRLVVSGVGQPSAEVRFHPQLTFITGLSNTGKSHILKCIDFAVGGPPPAMDFPEAAGYTRVQLEFDSDGTTHSVARDLEDDDTAEWFAGPIKDWDDEAAERIKVRISPKTPEETLSGRLLELGGFELADVIVKNQRGEFQALSFRAITPLVLVSEEDVISESSPILPPSFTQHTAARSAFQIVLSGRGPTDAEVRRLRVAHRGQERAKSQIELLAPIIATLRDEIAESGFSRGELEAELAQVDEQLAEMSELVAASGDAARALIRKRNDALARSSNAEARAIHAAELKERFGLLAKHYDADTKRLEFLLEGGHFFQQLHASYCPRCGRPLEDGDSCHEEVSEFSDIERAARAELKKLGPRARDLETAIEETETERAVALEEAERWADRAAGFESEIRQVANPTANSARARVRALGARRKELEQKLLSHRELDRYLAIKQEADLEMKKSLDRFRPAPTTSSLRSLQGEIAAVLTEWRFPFTSDVVFDVETDDLAIDGKARKANGKGVRAVTHAAFNVGLMRHCFAKKTPHPGFTVIDTPLTPFRGRTDAEEEPELRQDVHAACLVSLAKDGAQGQTIIIENIDPPPGLTTIGARVYVFSGPEGTGRQGFYPSPTSSARLFT